MKSWMKSSISIGLSLMFCLISIGYAALTDSITIFGDATAGPPEAIFITNISEISRYNIDENDFSFVPTTTNVINHI